VTKQRISFISPVYGCPEALPELYRRVEQTCANMGVDFELILVDDRCPLGSWMVIQSLAAIHPTIRGFRLTRNFGQHAAIRAGIAHATGDWFIILDCDLQDRPEEAASLMAKAQEGYKIVRARRIQRQDSFFRRAVSSLFYRTLGYLTETKQNSEIGNFGIYHRSVQEAIVSWTERDMFFPSIVDWIGFTSTTIEVQHDERHSGKSSYNIRSLLRLAQRTILAFSDKPLRLLVQFGLLIAGLSFLFGCAIFVFALSGQFQVDGWASLMVSLWFIGGVLTASVGIAGLYVGRILIEVKDRPVFLVEETVGPQ
jgi:dolichol-phosphate mannosyltransferase